MRACCKPKDAPAANSRTHATTGVGGILTMIVVGVLLVAGFIYTVALRAETVQDQYRVQQLMRLRHQLQRERQRLEQERAYYRSPHVLEPLARRLGLVRPDVSQIIVADADRGLTGGAASSAMSNIRHPGTRPVQAGARLAQMQATHRRSGRSMVRLVAERKQTVSRPLKRPRWAQSVDGQWIMPGLMPDAQTNNRREPLPKVRSRAVVALSVERIEQSVGPTGQR